MGQSIKYNELLDVFIIKNLSPNLLFYCALIAAAFPKVVSLFPTENFLTFLWEKAEGNKRKKNLAQLIPLALYSYFIFTYLFLSCTPGNIWLQVPCCNVKLGVYLEILYFFIADRTLRGCGFGSRLLGDLHKSFLSQSFTTFLSYMEDKDFYWHRYFCMKGVCLYYAISFQSQSRSSLIWLLCLAEIDAQQLYFEGVKPTAHESVTL